MCTYTGLFMSVSQGRYRVYFVRDFGPVLGDGHTSNSITQTASTYTQPAINNNL